MIRRWRANQALKLTVNCHQPRVVVPAVNIRRNLLTTFGLHRKRWNKPALPFKQREWHLKRLKLMQNLPKLKNYWRGQGFLSSSLDRI